ncbi:DUF4124 domain-containing protein [Variovorax sp. J22P240]|uniref:DUF4124 domain-containing protein n=1 Tax=unclassified Variovorax TaxID=663243 RepID=UPI0025784BE4|nr:MULTISPECIES: DUF4124 domain-containing protein [unclassified Variovorax]MDM0002470.1 DUF4124 domain-containing protein [Variovorax sp. J22P240]MDM0053321.1 DUF4124 domain-containing protein [Variovorax sp. J22R115]
MARTQALYASLALSLAAAGAVHAQPQAGARPATGDAGSGPSIYSCTDAKGRTITADRPIPDCIDREQRELNPSGTTRRKLEPTYTAREQAEREERERQAQLLAARQLEERRRERALLIRYPTPMAHDRERAEALVQIDAVIQAAKKRLGELADERKRIDDELEFYKKDPSKAPDSIRRKVEDNARSVAVQNRFIGEQEDEKKRVNVRFDEEQARLKPLWAAK